MSCQLVLIIFLASTCLITAARDLPKPSYAQSFNIKAMTAANEANGNTNSTNGTLSNCWNAIAEIKSCGNEITSYFSNGTIDIGLPCCQAIKMITLHCWPAMLTALGFTSDQYNVLVGYCDASAATPAPTHN